MIKNIFKRRKESDTYLTTVCRHRWSRQITKKVDKFPELSASTVAFISWRRRLTGYYYNILTQIIDNLLGRNTTRLTWKLLQYGDWITHTDYFERVEQMLITLLKNMWIHDKLNMTWRVRFTDSWLEGLKQ